MEFILRKQTKIEKREKNSVEKDKRTAEEIVGVSQIETKNLAYKKARKQNTSQKLFPFSKGNREENKERERERKECTET